MKTSSIPRHRVARFARFGGLAGSIAGGMLAEGVRQLSRGKLPRPSDLVLTPGNARRVAEQLAHLRGAAMKFGQLLSLDTGVVLPRELADLLARLRADARAMPMSELVRVLRASWGGGWEQHFRQFSFTPLAAASIGQVHSAVARDGRRLALKVQYPGIRQSIDSDVDNVAGLLRVTRLLPPELDVQPLLEEAKRQLHEEADYLAEAAHLKRFGALLADTPEFLVPDVDDTLTRDNILAMSFLEGESIEALVRLDRPVRDRVAALLVGLVFRELFEFGLIQTDPNFANFLYCGDTRRLALLDFGATRHLPSTVTQGYRALLGAALREDRMAMAESARAMGYFSERIHAAQREAVLDLFMRVAEPARCAGCYDFGSSDLPLRIRDAGLSLSLEQGYWHTPPADVLFIHRKLAGLYLLAARLRAHVDVRALLEPFVCV
jgi:predicted unusual protein kinase regulating ubiquinone biosynthesis (AarF/ABC1/UbiB family)